MFRVTILYTCVATSYLFVSFSDW